MQRLIVTCFTIAVMGVTGCAQNKNPADSRSNQESVDAASIDENRAREVSDTLAQAIINDQTKDLYYLMEKGFRDAASEQDVKPMLAQLYSVYGKPLEVEYKSDELGFKIYTDGTKKPMRKFWYAVRTSTQPKGTYYFFTEIVPDGDSPRCSSFSIVSFPLGVPDSLK
jgi:hypothetical protein